MSKQLITPELANEWVTAYFYEKSLMHSVMRNIREYHVDYLAKEMSNGTFGSATISFADCKENGRRFIVNGNHTLRAIAKSGVTLYLTVEQNECDTMEQVRHLYATYDKNLLRSRVDSLRAYHAGDVLGITQSDVGALSAAVVYILQGFGTVPGRIPDRVVLEEMKSWAEPFGHLLVAIGRSNPWYPRIARRRGVASVAIISMKYHRGIAFPFWQSVATGEGLHRYSPALRLRDFLIENGTLQGGKDGLSQAALVKTVAYCWNKQYRNERIVQMKVPYDKPLDIAGAPKSVMARTIKEPVTLATIGELVPA